MISNIILFFWILMKLNAPTWCFVIVGIKAFLEICRVAKASAKMQLDDELKKRERDELLKNLGGN